MKPHVIVIAGPNGAGKSTAAPVILRDYLGLTDYVNADLIAQGLSAFASETVAFEAGRIMLKRLRDLAARRCDFAFETTLATRSYAPWLTGLRETGYQVKLIFLWLPSPEAAVARVAERVRLGGHSVPEEVVRRRYRRGLHNFLHVYRQLADEWWLYDNSGPDGAIRVVFGTQAKVNGVTDQNTWRLILENPP
jgi:predicted ABC-type ATPase